MGCPLRNFKECPEHNKKGGCNFWMSYTSNKDTANAQMEGCAIVLTPILLLENANNLGIVAGEVNKVGAEVSASRVENIKEQQANRTQFINLALGNNQLINANHDNNIKELSNE